MARIFKGVLAFLAIVLLTLSGWAGWLAWRFHSSKPVLQAEITVEGLRAPVRIMRDLNGVPHIFGQTDADVYFGLGYAHAQDRLFQMDMIRRSVEGRLSEVLGSMTGTLDARARIRGDHLIAVDQIRRLKPETRAAIDAYTAGINAFIAEGSGPRAPEYALLMHAPEPWTPEDTAAVGVKMALDLTVGLAEELGRSRLSSVLSTEQLDQFFQPYPDYGPRTVEANDWLGGSPRRPELDPGSDPQSDVAPAAGVAEEPVPGSNAWAVNGDWTVTGAPLLANDPHLGLSSPGIWYLAHLSLRDGPVVGATLPGMPFVILGRNDAAAWGFTAAQIDVMDLVPSSDLPKRSRVETINIRFASVRKIEAQMTAFGPVLDPAYFRVDPETPVALRSSLTDKDGSVLNALHALMGARSWAEFVGATREWATPLVNMVYADAGGNIGFLTPGYVPERDAEGNWGSRLPDDALVRVLNPPSGMVLNANNKIEPDGHPHPLPGSYVAHRARRIGAELSKTRLHDRDSFTLLQNDVVSDHAQRILVALKRARPRTDLGRATLGLLEDWNGEMAADRAEPLVFSAWYEQLIPALYADELKDRFGYYNAVRPVFVEAVLNGGESQWCDNIASEATESCADIAGLALDAAAARLLETYGSNPETWRWGDAHQTVFGNQLMSALPIFNGLYTRSVATGGDGQTVNVAPFNLGASFDATFGAGFRAVYDFADLESSQFMVAPGQSGHPLSPHFDDMINLWAAGDYVEIPTQGFDPEFPPPDVSVLTLVPARGG